MTCDHAGHRAAQRLQLVDIFRKAQDRSGQPPRLFPAVLRRLIEHRLYRFILEQPGVHGGGDRQAMFAQGGAG